LSLLAAASLALTACANSSTKGDGATAGASTNGSTKVSDLLPAAVKDRGYMTVVSSWNYPPFVLQEADKSYHGLEVDVLDQVGAKLGIKVKYEFSEGFATLVPSVSSGKYDLATGAIGVNPDRLKTVSYVQWVKLQEGLVVQAGNPKNVNTKDLCGHSISVESGSVEIDLYGGISKECQAAGKPAMDVKIFPSEAALLLAVQSGRADAAALGMAVAEYKAKGSGGRLEVAPGGPIKTETDLPTGVVFDKKNAELGKAILSAMQQLQSEGKVKEILTKWGIPDAELPAKFVE
jgi:polar amino acid transport system substrate-binding protein